MTPTRKKRLFAVLLILIGVGTATAVFLTALGDNINLYKSPSDIDSGNFEFNRNFRIGGMVKTGSIIKSSNSLDVDFLVTDFAKDVRIHYSGILPDLFRDNQGMVATGQLDKDCVFQAEEILAKHDENYMPPEVASSLKNEKDENNVKIASQLAQCISTAMENK